MRHLIIATSGLCSLTALSTTFAYTFDAPIVVVIVLALLMATTAILLCALVIMDRERYANKLDRDMRTNHGTRLERPLTVVRELRR